MFELNHLLWLLISTFVITFHILINIKYKPSFKANLTALFIVAVISEITKILINMESLVGDTFDTSGTYLNHESLPFHLCAMQIFFITALMFFVKNESTKSKILGFMVPTMLMGAALALFIPTNGTDFTDVQVYQYFIFHSYLIAFAVYLLYSKNVVITFKVMFRNIAYLLGLGVICIYINGMFSFAATNFMFISRPPMENLPFLNLNQGWYMYFAKLLIILMVLMVSFHLPFALCYRKNQKERNL